MRSKLPTAPVYLARLREGKERQARQFHKETTANFTKETTVWDEGRCYGHYERAVSTVRPEVLRAVCAGVLRAEHQA
jgi:hypothetical protein